jgi:exosome complex exonuclease RRP6
MDTDHVLDAAAYQYGNFPAPPRAYREVKTGNQSHTFR